MVMPLLTKDCLERLRQRMDLSEIVGAHIELKRQGGKIKALCPFHNEKTPSFTVNSGDSHYHCFGCGAHGDGVAFLMNFLGLSFNEAVEYLANKYSIQLEYTGKKEQNVEYKRDLFRINQRSAEFFHFHLLHSEEAKPVLEYLFKRGITEDFIKKFMIGYSPKGEQFQKTFYRSEKFTEELLVMAGILSESVKRPFFSERIMFPIHDGVGNVIGFSGRKIEDRVFGGKYINTKETKIFKKSRTLFGLNYSRRSIAKTGRVIVVEGQIDALRLIFEGFDNTVASQGTAFGEEHVGELLKLGITEVLICFDGDEAGDKSAIKVGQLFQKEGIEVFVCSFAKGMDPDTYLLEHGKDAFARLCSQKEQYMSFLVKMLSRDGKAASPAGKNAIAATIKKMMAEWKHPIMIHEGEKALARLLNVPSKYLVTTKAPVVKRAPVKNAAPIDPIEKDLLRWLLLAPEKDLIHIIMDNIEIDYIYNHDVKEIFSLAKELHREGQNIDLLHLGMSLTETQIKFLEEIKSKRMNTLKAREGITNLCQKMIDNEWNRRGELIQSKMRLDGVSEEEVFALAKEFDENKKNKKNILERE
ncbi:MAG: DNA primase [Chlamydiia bacterium]|nr:DNA primase [Chlamydiia bacterium]